jgi:hypothetical protein
LLNIDTEIKAGAPDKMILALSPLVFYMPRSYWGSKLRFRASDHQACPHTLLGHESTPKQLRGCQSMTMDVDAGECK